MWEIWVWSLGREDSLEKEMATHSSTLAWRIQWREEPGRPRKESSDFIPTSFSLFMSFIFFPTSFWKQWVLFWEPDVLCQHSEVDFLEFIQRSNVLLMNLWGRKWSSRSIPLPSRVFLRRKFIHFLISRLNSWRWGVLVLDSGDIEKSHFTGVLRPKPWVRLTRHRTTLKPVPNLP